MEDFGEGEGGSRRVGGNAGVQPSAAAAASGRRLGLGGGGGGPPRRIGVGARERAFAAFESVVNRPLSPLESQALTAALAAFQNPAVAFSSANASANLSVPGPVNAGARAVPRKVASPSPAAPSFPALGQQRPAPQLVKRPTPAWKATDGSKVQAAARSVNSILNKLTYERFQTLSDQLIALEIDSSQEILEKTIEIIFDKALAEPQFSALYTELCAKLNANLRSVQGSNGQELTFRKLLLAKCRDMFVRKTKIEGATNTEAEALRSQVRKRVLGNAIFVGELYKKQLISEKVMHQNVQLLLSDATQLKDEEAMESVAKLLTVVGKQLDRPEAKNWMDVYFQRIEQLSKDTSVTSRVRFMLLDLLEIRGNGWDSGRDDEAPKKAGETNPEHEYRVGPTVVRHPADGHVHQQHPQHGHHPHNSHHSYHGHYPHHPHYAQHHGHHAPQQNHVTLLQRTDRHGSQSGMPHGVAPLPGYASNHEQGRGAPFHDSAAPRQPQTPEEVRAATAARIRSILVEWIMSEDVRELVASVAQEDGAMVVAEAAHLAVERKPVDVEKLASALAVLSESGSVPRTDFEAGLKSTVANIKKIELDLDIPLTAQTIGGFVGTLSARGGTSIGILNVLVPVAPRARKATLLIPALIKMRQLVGEDAFLRRCEEGNLDVVACVGNAMSHVELVNLLRSHGMTELLPDRGLEVEFTELLAKNATAGPEVEAWIKARRPPARAEQPRKEEFVWTVTEVIVRKCVDRARSSSAAEKWAAIDGAMEQYAGALRLAIAGEIALEVRCAFAAQKVWFEEGSADGLLDRLFRFLHAANLVSRSGFQKWREDTADSTPGKIEALYQVNAFVVSVSEAAGQEEDDDDDDN